MINFLTRIAQGNKTSEVKGHDADDSKNIKQSLWKIAGKFKCHVRRLIQFAPAIDNLSPLDFFLFLWYWESALRPCSLFNSPRSCIHSPTSLNKFKARSTRHLTAVGVTNRLITLGHKTLSAIHTSCSYEIACNKILLQYVRVVPAPPPGGPHRKHRRIADGRDKTNSSKFH